MGRIHLAGARASEAEVLFRRALAIREAAFPSTHWQVFEARTFVANALTAQGSFVEAEPLLLEALAGLEAQRGPADPYVREAVAGLVALNTAWGRPAQADEYRGRLAPEGTPGG